MIFTPDEITLLVACMKRNGVAALDIRQDAEELRLVGAAGAGTGTPSAPRKATQTISAKAFGVLHLEQDLGAAIEAGDVIATIAAGLLRRPVTAPVAGQLTKILARESQRVEYGTPLFEMLETKGLS